LELKEKEDISIWVLLPLTWPAASYWEDAVNAYQIAVNKVNSSWWINWRKIVLNIEDTKCNWKTAVDAVQKLINIDKTKIILWWICSWATIPSWKISQRKKIPQISPISAASWVSKIWNYVRRFQNNDNITIKSAEFVNSKNSKNIAIIAENTDYWVGYMNWFISKYNWNISLKEKYNPEEKDFSIIAKKILKKINEIDFLLIVPNSDWTTIWLMQALKKEWILEKMKWRIIASDIVAADKNINTIWKDSMEGIYISSLPNLDSLNDNAKKIIKNFKNSYEIKSQELYILLETEAINLVIDWIKENWYSSEWIQEYLNGITNNNKRNWVFWEYYFKWNEVVWLGFTIKQIKDWKRIPIK